ncbi:WYL domain-containing protein [Actinophytocola xinjiangensis]|uniref:WYL domain-containing protein n=1 Tax=Actinophytocola xinjiangensis TaxID=485602 RepID=A0A7Z1AZ98_9PSEU|nr:WYL domain-containing protein [Actinophytocola xinjiangensis]OLF10442.1 WYL domain-containing protein [Actinophytocola xinjiangensis]
MRADRLVATLLFLQSRGRVTAAEVAEELEISVATARRDLEALSTAGIPVYPQPGRGGGWSLVGGARTDLSGLTSTEAQALFLLVGPAAAVAPEAKAALRKLVAALPRTFREDAAAAASAVVIDSARWGDPVTPRPELVARLQNAVVRRLRVRFSYASKGKPAQRRVVDPWGLVDKDDSWYLIAGTERGRRTFRVDRISGAEVTDEPASRPAEFDLDAAWREVVARVEDGQRACTAVVRVPARLVSVLRRQFGQHCVVVEERDGVATVRVSAPAPVMVAQHLAGWGAGLEVVESDAVRAELARIGRELAGLYG